VKDDVMACGFISNDWNNKFASFDSNRSIVINLNFVFKSSNVNVTYLIFEKAQMIISYDG